ncbi:chemotaxis response regulator protein-glutamate methylesterase [Shewanella maritima]|uniref:protein-glutamate methylesterase/protein-glutamine glutaminase n=1 Tax=Shewanella maritima TaxID=2520507 RepID=UPI003736C5CF
MIKVLVIDDSAFMRQVLSHLLEASDNIQVVGTAKDPYEARVLLKTLKPDVITLDVEMPKMDGLAFLRNLMRLRPMPVVMVSSLTQKGADVTLEAIDLGAVDFIAKPRDNTQASLSMFQQQLVDKVTGAAEINIAEYLTTLSTPSATKSPHSTSRQQPPSKPEQLIAIGASTGGIEAIQYILQTMPLNCPPIVIAQHIPPVFSRSFANRLNNNCDINVIEAKGGELLSLGTAYIAPGDQHLQIECVAGQLKTKLNDAPAVNRHKPSVDVLFDSIAEHAATKAIGVILTGMGHDGGQGLLNMKLAGAHTIAQNKASSIVWGMPGTAVSMGAAKEQQPLDTIPSKLLQLMA